MLDIKLIREQTRFVKEELAKTGVDEGEIDRLLEADAERRRLQHELDDLRARRTRESKELGRLAPADRDARRAEMRELGDKIGAGERELANLEQRFNDHLQGLRNLPRPNVPVGKSEADNPIIRIEGEQRKFDFSPLPHWELGERLGIIDFARGVKLSGYALLCPDGARCPSGARSDRLDARPQAGTGLRRGCAAAYGQSQYGDSDRPSDEVRQ